MLAGCGIAPANPPAPAHHRVRSSRDSPPQACPRCRECLRPAPACRCIPPPSPHARRPPCCWHAPARAPAGCACVWPRAASRPASGSAGRQRRWCGPARPGRRPAARQCGRSRYRDGPPAAARRQTGFAVIFRRASDPPSMRVGTAPVFAASVGLRRTGKSPASWSAPQRAGRQGRTPAAPPAAAQTQVTPAPGHPSGYRGTDRYRSAPPQGRARWRPCGKQRPKRQSILPSGARAAPASRQMARRSTLAQW